MARIKEKPSSSEIFFLGRTNPLHYLDNIDLIFRCSYEKRILADFLIDDDDTIE